MCYSMSYIFIRKIGLSAPSSLSGLRVEVPEPPKPNNPKPDGLNPRGVGVQGQAVPAKLPKLGSAAGRRR